MDDFHICPRSTKPLLETTCETRRKGEEPYSWFCYACGEYSAGHGEHRRTGIVSSEELNRRRYEVEKHRHGQDIIVWEDR